MLPLRDLLRELELEAVAGEAGLDRAVRWVHSSELLDPTPWLSGGELLLTTGLQLTGDDVMRAYVARLAGHGLTGLGFGAGFGHEHVPDALRSAAAEHGFPVFEVPYEVPFIAITEKAFTQLVNEQYAVLRRALSAHERLERIVLSERGLDGVAAGLGAMVGGPALIFDARGEVLARRAGRAGLSAEIVRALGAELRERARAGARRGYVPSAEGFPAGALALPVVRGTARGDPPLPEAWLVAAKDAGALTELDRLTLHQAVTIVALELLRRRVVDDTERRLAGDVLTALVAGDLSGAELARRLEPFGLRERAGALVIAPPRGARAVAEESLARALRDEVGGGLVAAHGRFLCALLPASDDEELFALAARVHARVTREAGQPLPAGAGRVVALGGLAARVPRGALRAGGAGAGAQRRRLLGAGHLPRPRVLPAAALAPGRRRAAAVLRLDPRPDRGLRRRLRRRADALAGSLHRVQRAMGTRGQGPLLSPSHAPLSDPPCRGVDRTLTRQRARSN